jgi:P27 family predicted phage terminase small subunit
MGRRGPKPANNRAVVDQPDVDFDPPADLTGPALDEWRRTLPLLRDLRVLSPTDAGAIGDLCRMHGYLAAIDAKIRKEGLLVDDGGRQREHPLLKTRKAYADSVFRMRRDFGLTPSARTTVRIEPPAPEVDEIEAFKARREQSPET